MGKLKAGDLDTDRIDDRWTLDKLRRAGYDLEWAKPCRSCGDLIEAYKWYTLSAMTFRASEAKSRGLVVRNRDQLAAQMTPAEIEEAHRRAREWRPK